MNRHFGAFFRLRNVLDVFRIKKQGNDSTIVVEGVKVTMLYKFKCLCLAAKNSTYAVAKLASSQP